MLIIILFLVISITVALRIGTSATVGGMIARRLPPTSSDHVEVGSSTWFEFRAKEKNLSTKS